MTAPVLVRRWGSDVIHALHADAGYEIVQASAFGSRWDAIVDAVPATCGANLRGHKVIMKADAMDSKHMCRACKTALADVDKVSRQAVLNVIADYRSKCSRDGEREAACDILWSRISKL